MNLDAAYWANRYKTDKTGWDIGHPNFGLLEEVFSRFPRTTKILIPGAGRGYEAEALWDAGYLNTYVCDWAPEAFEGLAKSPVFAKAFSGQTEAKSRLIVADFFALEGQYDLILEQTFFCAINPEHRVNYVKQAAHLLKPVGKWMGIFFDCNFPTEGPPFGGDEQTYRTLFEQHFDIAFLKRFKASIKPRQDKEILGLMHCKSM